MLKMLDDSDNIITRINLLRALPSKLDMGYINIETNPSSAHAKNIENDMYLNLNVGINLEFGEYLNIIPSHIQLRVCLRYVITNITARNAVIDKLFKQNWETLEIPKMTCIRKPNSNRIWYNINNIQLNSLLMKYHDIEDYKRKYTTTKDKLYIQFSIANIALDNTDAVQNTYKFHNIVTEERMTLKNVVILPYVSDVIELRWSCADKELSVNTNNKTAHHTLYTPKDIFAARLGSIASSCLCNYRMIDTVAALRERSYLFHNVNRRPIVIKEEYGATIGSHLWDSSIILNEYLLRTYMKHIEGNFDYTYKIGIELGAGCGLNGLTCSQQYDFDCESTTSGTHTRRICKYMFLSDKSYQHEYLIENIALNKDCMENELANEKGSAVGREGLGGLEHSSGGCYAIDIDWNDFASIDDSNRSSAPNNYLARMRDIIGQVQTDISDVDRNTTESSTTQTSIDNRPIDVVDDTVLMDNCSLKIDLILAADVLYDKDVIQLLFKTITYLSTPMHTIIYIAQKDRRKAGDHSNLYDLTQLEAFDCKVVHQEANVMIWRCMLRYK